MAVDLLLVLRAFEESLARVDDDDAVARVHEGRVLRLVLTSQHARNFRRQTAHGLARRVHDVPLAIIGERVPAGKIG